MTFQKKEQPEQPKNNTEQDNIQVMFGNDDTTKDNGGTPPAAAAQFFGSLPRYKPGMREDNTDLCTVLHGYGVDRADLRKYVDDYTFIGGVGKNIPRNVANAWRLGKRWQDDKPAVSRVYIQAILPNDANEVDYAKATGVQPMEPAKLAAMIGATDAAALVKAMGRQQAIALSEELRKQVSTS